MKTNKSTITRTIKSLLADILALTIAGTTITANAEICHTDNECLTEGYFEDGMIFVNDNGEAEYHYHFKSFDDEVWWFVSEAELGFVPKANAAYYFVYSDNGTTHCDCPPEYDCDCFVYDDIFISCEEVIE